MKTAKQVAIALAMTLGATRAIEAQTPNANTYLQTVLVSNVASGSASVDPNLMDPWGISASNFWVSDHLSGKSTVYSAAGVVSATVAVIPPGSASPAGSLGPANRDRQFDYDDASFFRASVEWQGGVLHLRYG